VSSHALEHYLSDDTRRGTAPAGAHSGSAGGAPCGDLVRISLVLEDGAVAAARFDAEGCAAARAAAAAVCELVEGESLLAAAAVGTRAVSEELEGLSPQGRHGAELAADALHRALGAAIAPGGGAELLPAPAAAERVLVALSGGVDSAVAALSERDRGREVVAVTLKLWADRHNDGARSCCSPEAVVGARALAHDLGLPHLTLDLTAGFRETVVGGFLSGHAAGRTPNPCVRCNGELRIDAMLELARRLGAGALATGHYARIADDGDGPLLAAAADGAKDQTYMLSALNPRALARLRFPLASLTKPEVRERAARAGLAVASKRESQDLCFLAGEGKRSFLARHGGLRRRPGELVDRSGRVLGVHDGHHEFTVGQRRGIGLGGPDPLYVLAKDADSNQVVVGTRDELAADRVDVRDVVLHRPGARVTHVRLRYHSRRLRCRVGDLEQGTHERAQIELEEPALGVAPGQTACLMDGDLVVGHGTIAASDWSLDRAIGRPTDHSMPEGCV
jgi:tRNA-specific 2-thiouridylase